MPLNTALVSHQKEVFTGNLNNPYSNSDQYRSHPFPHFWESIAKWGFTSTAFPCKNNTGREHKGCLWVGLHRVFCELGMYKTHLPCHRSIQLSAWLCCMNWDHQYRADGFRDIQNLAGKVPEQPDVTAPALWRCWTTWPTCMATTGPRYIHFWVSSPVASSIHLWMIPSCPDGHYPKGGSRMWLECSFHVWLRVFNVWDADTITWVEQTQIWWCC